MSGQRWDKSQNIGTVPPESVQLATMLQQCLQFDDAGVKPVRASGSRWVIHKLSGGFCLSLEPTLDI